MTTTTDVHVLAQRAAQLRALHHAAEPLLLPNAWDAASARCVAEAGFHAVATTSSGVAAALGYADGEQMPIDEAFAAVARIARSVQLPVTADLEAGYGLSPEQFVERLLAAGAVGCNLEDTDHTANKALRAPAAQAAWLRSVKSAARAAGVDIVVNARVDTFIRNHSETDSDIADALARAHDYLAAGADSIYPILVFQESTIATLVKSIPAPINVFAHPQAPPVPRLAELGVKRVSFAGRLQANAMADLTTRLTAIKNGQSPYEAP